jgi:hypothetical protein
LAPQNFILSICSMVHVFPANLAVLHAAREALDITDDFLRRNLAR